MRKPNLIIKKNGTLNKREPIIGYGDPELMEIVAFEKNPIYNKYHFISSYPVSPEAFEIFVDVGNIGQSQEEKMAKINDLLRIQAQTNKKIANAGLFRSTLPKNARLGNKQLPQIKRLQNQLEADPNFQLTIKEKILLDRAKRYEHHKQQFCKKNPHISKDEL